MGISFEIPKNHITSFFQLEWNDESFYLSPCYKVQFINFYTLKTIFFIYFTRKIWIEEFVSPEHLTASWAYSKPYVWLIINYVFNSLFICVIMQLHIIYMLWCSYSPKIQLYSWRYRYQHGIQMIWWYSPSGKWTPHLRLFWQLIVNFDYYGEEKEIKKREKENEIDRGEERMKILNLCLNVSNSLLFIIIRFPNFHD